MRLDRWPAEEMYGICEHRSWTGAIFLEVAQLGQYNRVLNYTVIHFASTTNLKQGAVHYYDEFLANCLKIF